MYKSEINCHKMGLKWSQIVDFQLNKIFKFCDMNIHLGEKITQVSKEKGISIAELARRINTVRRNMYVILTKEDMQVSLLWKISEALDYNFFELLRPVIKPGEPGAVSPEKRNIKKSGKKLTVRFDVEYPVELSDELPGFLLHVNSVAEKIGYEMK